jgi:RHS repeat-associated protein
MFLRKWQQRGAQRESLTNGNHRRAPRRGGWRLQLESLEQRILPATDLWTGLSPVSDSWSDPANWQNQVAPLPGDTVLFSSGANRLTSTVDGLYANASFTLQMDSGWGGILNLATSVTLVGKSQWAAGLINMQGNTLTTTGLVTLTNATGSYVQLYGAQNTGGALVNSGTIVQEGGDLRLDGGVQLNNQAGGTYDFTSDGGITVYSDNEVVSNAGMMEKTGGSGVSMINPGFSNLGGTLAADSGTLRLADEGFGGTSTGGILNAAQGAAIDICGGSSANVFTGNYSGSGQGAVLITNGTLNIGGGGATFDFPQLQWSGGQINVQGNTLTNSGLVTLPNAAGSYVQLYGAQNTGGVLVNRGTMVEAGGGDLRLDGGVQIDNQAGGVYDFASDGGITVYSANEAVSNAGTMEKTGGTGISTINPGFSNLGGTLGADSGTLRLADQGFGGTSTGGILNTAQGAAIDICGGSYANVFTGSYTGSGQGAVVISNGTLNIGGRGATFDFPQLQWSGGWINLQGNTLTNTGLVTLTNSPASFVQVYGAQNAGGALVNKGSIVEAGGGDLRLDGGVQLNNQAGGVYDFASDGGVTLYGGNDLMINGGTVEKTAGTGTSSIQVGFTNGGVLQVQTGTIQVAGDLRLNGSAAIAESDLGTLSVPGNVVGNTRDASLFAPRGTVLLTGSGPQMLEVMSQDVGNVPAGFAHNFAYGTLDVSGSVQLVDNAHNSSGTGVEALYVDSLIVEPGATLDLNGLHAYARYTQINGQVINGTVNPAPDGGPLDFDSTAPGTISPAGEVDDWTFFGRAGQGVSVTLATGSGGSPAPLSPTLNYGQLTILDPGGNVVASTSNIQTGADADLLGVTLAADGIYHVRVQAPAAQVASVGNYVLGLFDATVHSAPVNFDQQVNGQLGTPFNVDQWTFGAPAKEQISFNFGGAKPGVEFDLTGPGGVTVFSGLTADSGPVTLPATGVYTLAVHAVAGEGGAYAFRLTEISQITLNLGTPYNGTLAGSGQAQLFLVNVPAGQQLMVTLGDSSAADNNELYARFGTPPTRAEYDYRFQTPGSANQELLVPAAAPGTWYILLYGESVPAASSYALMANAAVVLLNGSTPATGSTASDTTLTLQGAGFNLIKNVKAIAAGGGSYQATAVNIVSPEKLSATFAAGTVPAGKYTVQVTLADGTTAQLPGALTVVQGGRPNFQVQIVVPNPIGRHSASTLYVQYSNTGDGPMPAPLLNVTGVLDGKQGAFLTLDASRQTAGFWTSATPAGFSQAVQFLASGATPGILQPGESESVPVYYAGWIQSQWDFSGAPVTFSVGVLRADDPTPIDWSGVQANLRPPTISAAAWAPMVTNLEQQTGATWGNFVAQLDANAAYVGQLGENVTDIGRLWSFAVQQADGLSPYTTLGTIVDDQVAAPGLALSFERAFLPNLSGRYQSGPFGFGWTWTGGWQRTLTVASDGTVTIANTDGSDRVFQPDSRASEYFAQPGDHGTLTTNGDGTYTLTEANGPTTHFLTDGQLDYVQDTNGNRITAGYTGSLLTSLSHSSGQYLHIVYNAAGLVASVTDSAGRVTAYTYDSANEHLLSVTGFDGRTVRYSYDTSASPFTQNALLSITNPDGTHDLFSYDPQGRLAGTQHDGGAEPVSFTYDRGLITTTDALGDSFKSFYDDRGLPLRVEDPLGNAVSTTYDSNFNMTKVTDPSGQAYHYTYDANGNLVQATDPLSHTDTFSYTSSLGRLASFTDANGNPTQYDYDGNGNLTSTIYADGTVESLAYDPLGNVTQSTSRRGQAIGYTYDSSGRVLSEAFPDGSRNSYTYDAHGNLTSATDPSGTAQLTYDAKDQLTQITYPSGRFLKYSHDSAGRRIQMVDQSGFAVNYQYDAVGRLAGLTDGSGKTIVSYTYDAAGRLARKDLANGTSTTYAYDAAGQPLHLVNSAPGGTVNSHFDYTYDALGRPTAMTTLDGQWAYTYDTLGELTHAFFTSNNPASVPNQDLQYTYDAAENRVSTTINGVTTQYVTNRLNEYTSIGSEGLAYDRDGNLVSQSDASGASTFTYDSLDRLVGVTTPAGDSSTYQYDAIGNLITSSDNGQATNYLVDPGGLQTVVGEYNGSGSLIAHYTWGLGLTSRVDSTATAAYYDFDALGSTAGVSGAAGGYLDSYRYLPFGETSATATVPNPFQYVGQFAVKAAANNMQVMGARFYMLQQGRFNRPDPMGLAGGLNSYSYGTNNPVSLIDPSGFQYYQGDVFGGPIKVGVNIPMMTTLDPLGESQIFFELGTKWSTPGAEGGIVFSNLPAPGFSGSASTSSSKVSVVIPMQNILNLLTPYDPPAGTPAGFWFPPNPSPPYGCDVGLENGTPDQNCMPPAPTPDAPGEPGGNGASNTVGEIDPNAKLGPSGFGPSGFVRPNTLFPYRIDFENDPKATAPAQSVTISDPLDRNLDWSSFHLTEIGFGDTIIEVPVGSQHFQTTVNTTENGKTFQVQIEAGIHSQTGQVYASFYSIDPATGLPPDVLTGFLPPEDGTGRGMGYVSYSILPNAGLPTGTQIRNVALVTFGVNPAIATDQVDDEDPTKGTDPAKMDLVTIDASTVSHLVVGVPTQAVAGGKFGVSVDAVDDVGVIDQSLSGTAVLRILGGPAGGKLSGVLSASIVNGVATFSNLALSAAGTYTLLAASSSDLIAGTASLSVVPAPQFKVTLAPANAGNTAAGQPFTVTIGALLGGKPDAGYVGTVRISSSDPQVAPTTATFGTGDKGAHTVTIKLLTPSKQTVTVADSSLASDKGTSNAVAVTGTLPLIIDHFTLAGFPTTAVAGTGHTVTITAVNVAGQPVANYTGTVKLTSSDPTFPANVTVSITKGVGKRSVIFNSTGAQTLTATATDGSGKMGTQANILVISPATHLGITASPTKVMAGGQVTLTVKGLTAANNVDVLFTDTLQVTTSDPHAQIVPGPIANGIETFAITFTTAGTQTTQVSDLTRPAIKGVAPSIIVSPAAVAQLSVTGFPQFVVAGAAQHFTVTALDSYGNRVVNGFTDTVQVAGQSYSFKSSDHGVHAFTAALSTLGTQSLTATDSTNANVHAGTEGNITVVSAAVSVAADPTGSGAQALIIIAPVGGGSIIITPANSAGTALSVTVNGKAATGSPFALTPADHIIVYGQGRSDVVKEVAVPLGGTLATVTVPAILLGGTGMNTLSVAGSSANNVLVGGAGKNVLTGGAGRDILIGAGGSSTLQAGTGDDILVAGSTIYDANLAALLALMAEWGSADVYLRRVRDLFGDTSGGLNGAFLLNADTVVGHSAVSQLFGGQGTDWFWIAGSAKSADKINDYTAGGVITVD